MKTGIILVACVLAALNDASAATEADGDLSMHTQQATFSGSSQAIWYLYSLNPDCTSGGLPKIEIIRAPSHGSIQVENVASFSAYPSTNQRYQCNKLESPMVRAVYTPEHTFVGIDKFVLRGAYASGNSLTKQIVVTIEVPQSKTVQDPLGASSTPNEMRLISVVSYTPPRMDPAYPLKIDRYHYPPGSLRAREQGRCLVEVTIEADGRPMDAKILESSGYPRLDKACLDAFVGAHFIPAIENGAPIQKTISLPLTWMLAE